jgi:hypothetical protein
LDNKNANQTCFAEILFHFSEVAVGIEFAREKKLFFTGFAHHKIELWKSCELSLRYELHVNCFYTRKKYLDSATLILKGHGYFILYAGFMANISPVLVRVRSVTWSHRRSFRAHSILSAGHTNQAGLACQANRAVGATLRR